MVKHFTILILFTIISMVGLLSFMVYVLWIDNPEVEGEVVEKYIRDNGEYRLIIRDNNGDYYRCSVSATQYFEHDVGDEFKGSVYWFDKE